MSQDWGQQQSTGMSNQSMDEDYVGKAEQKQHFLNSLLLEAQVKAPLGVWVRV